MNAEQRAHAAHTVQVAIEAQEDTRAVLAAAHGQAHAALRDGDHNAHAMTALMVLAARRAYVHAVRARIEARSAEVTLWEAVATEVAAHTPTDHPEQRRHVAALLLEVARDREAIERERAAWLGVRS